VTPAGIYRFLMSVPVSEAQLRSGEWREVSYANQCLAQAFAARRTEQDHADYAYAADYLLSEMVALSDRTRSSIVSTVTSMLAKQQRGWMRELWAGETTVRFED